MRLVSTSPPPPTSNSNAPGNQAVNQNQPGAQFANQVLAGAPLANQQIPGFPGQAGPQLANQGLDGSVIDNIVDVDNPVEDEFLTLANPWGSGGECRHNNHCRGSQRCVRRNGKHICTTRYCNVDSDCEDSRLCRDQRCRRCRRCRDELQATVPKGK